jgi:hypothetical protein
LLLLVVVVCLFRPDFVLNQVSPAYAPVDFKKFVAGAVAIEPGRNVRFHVTRETNYGDRFKLFLMTAPDKPEQHGPAAFGAMLETAEVKRGFEKKGDYVVADMGLNSAVEKAGLDFGDYITEVDVEQLDRPAKEWVYPLALLLLGAILWFQWTRRRREATPGPVDIAA